MEMLQEHLLIQLVYFRSIKDEAVKILPDCFSTLSGTGTVRRPLSDCKSAGG